MKKQYVNAPTILLSFFLIAFLNIKVSMTAQAPSEILTITESLTAHITKASVIAGGFMGVVSLYVRFRDKRTDENGNWKINDKIITKDERWKNLKTNYFFSQDTIPYLLDTTLGTVGDYKKVIIEKVIKEETLEDNSKMTYEKTKCFATGSGFFGWIDKNIFQHVPKATNDAAITLTAFGLVQKAIECNSNKEQEQKSK